MTALLPGKSLHLALALCLLARTQGTCEVALSNSACRQFAIDRNAKYRALNCLEKAGLIQVKRKLGRSPLVTIRSRGALP